MRCWFSSLLPFPVYFFSRAPFLFAGIHRSLMPFGDLWNRIIFAHSPFYVIISWTNGTAYGPQLCSMNFAFQLGAWNFSRGAFHFDAFRSTSYVSYMRWELAWVALLRNIIVCHSDADYAFREMKYNYFRVNFSICPANECDPGAFGGWFRSLWWAAYGSYTKTNFKVQEIISHIAQLNRYHRLLPVCLSSTVDRFNWMPNEENRKIKKERRTNRTHSVWKWNV